MRLVPFLYAVSFFAVFSLSATASAAEKTVNPDEVSDAVRLDIQRKIAAPVSDAEKIRIKIIEDAVSSADKSGAWAALAERSPTYLTLRDVALLALEGNLTLRMSRIDPTVANAVLKEAEAVFFPTFELAVGYDRSQTFDRTFVGIVDKKAFFAGGNNSISIPTGSNSPAVNQIVFRSQQRQTGVVQTIDASKKKDFVTADETWSYDMALSQQLPWGPVVSVSTASDQINLFYRRDHEFEKGDTSTDLDMDLTLPLPGFKGFGEYAPFDAQIKLAEKSRERAVWEVKETINSILQEAEAAYWNVVQSLEELHAEIENHKVVADQTARVKRRYELRRATSYEMALAESEMAKIDIRVEEARNAFLRASNTLTELLTDKPEDVHNHVVIPYSYSGKMNDWIAANEREAIESAMVNRPLLKARKIGEEEGYIGVKAAENAALPDVLLTGHLDLDQNGSTYGYADVAESLKNLGNPDHLGLSGALTYTYPWGNRGPKAAHTSAALSHTSTQLATRETERAITSEIGTVITGLASARSRVNLAKNEEKRTSAVIANLDRRQKIGADVVQNEILVSAKRLLDARLSLVSALIENKQNEVRLLAAQGTLASEYGGRAAINDLDAHRVKVLELSGVLNFFKSLGLGGDDQSKKTN